MATQSSWSDSVAFGSVCNLLEKILEDKTKSKKMQRLSDFFDQCRNYFKAKEDSLYPVLRLLLPQKDEERGSYGIKETMLTKILIEVLELPPNGKEAKRLKNYTAPPSTSTVDDQNDYGSVFYSIIKEKEIEKEAVTVTEVNKRLSKIADLKGPERLKEIKDILMYLLTRMSALQMKWIVRIILKSVKPGLGVDTVVGLVHPDAKELYNVNGSLKEVCSVLKDPRVLLNEIGIAPFSAFKPMLAETGVIGKVLNQMNNKEFYIQTKFDGERMLAHFKDKKFKFFSRNRKDFTDNFGDSAASGKFCKFLNECLAPSVYSVILDGEICSFNHETQSLVTKGKKQDVRHIQKDDSTYQQCFCIYDIVFLNGDILTNLPLRKRLELLKKTVPKEIQGRVQLTTTHTAHTLDEVLDSLENAIKEREEGIVLKDPDSFYKPDVRNKGGWVKVKPEYSDELMDMPDLIIMGGYFAKGRRRGGTISHFILGVSVKQTASFAPSEFRSFCRVGAGYNDNELNGLLQKLLPHFKRGKPPPNLKMGSEKPDVWIEPEHSVIVKVKAAEIIKSSDYATGWTLRFPRVEEIRADKDWFDGMTYQELQDLLRLTGGSLTRIPQNKDIHDVVSQSPVRKKPRNNTTQRTVGVPLVYRPADLRNVKMDTCELHDRVIVVEPSLNDGGALKARLEKIATKYGAKIEQNPTAGITYCYVVTMEKARAQMVINRGYCNVVKSSWLLDCENSFQQLRPSYMIYTVPETQAEFSRRFDAYGDGYFDHTTEASLKFSLSQVAGDQATLEAVRNFESEHLPSNKCGLFAGKTFYFDKYLVWGDEKTAIEFHPLNIVEETALFYGGKVSTNPNDPTVTHIIVDEEDKSRKDKLQLIQINLNKRCHIVYDTWINDSLASLRLLRESDYRVT